MYKSKIISILSFFYQTIKGLLPRKSGTTSKQQKTLKNLGSII